MKGHYAHHFTSLFKVDEIDSISASSQTIVFVFHTFHFLNLYNFCTIEILCHSIHICTCHSRSYYKFQVSLEEEFLQLSSCQLLNLIQRDELNVPDEKDVYNAVLKWVMHDEDTRQPKMEHILQAVR